MKLSFFVSTIFIAVYLVFLFFSTFIVFFVYVFVYLGQLLAQFKNTALLSLLPTLYAYVYVSVFYSWANK